ncbi:MAG TPA: hypothetical protein VG328_21215 [Stellaceae bacterium]|jgi:hypothetical protein|nr:hypothetical protein [Stellaceae bacterium]
MSRTFKIATLDNASRAQAFPLLRATWPDLDLEDWLAFADRFANSGDTSTGLVGLRDDSGALCGLFVYRIGHTLRDERILSIPLFTAMDLANSLEPVRALLNAVKDRAELCDCLRLRIELASEQTGLANRLHRLGTSRCGMVHSIELRESADR